jgi:putative endonuclease
MDDDPRQVLGKSGEEVACGELQRRGYAIVARRYRTRAGEIDIVARDGPTIVFVEVKTRRKDEFGDPLEAVTSRKQRKLTLMALDFLARVKPGSVPCRFDVVSVRWSERAGPDVEVVKNAFLAGGWS